jgi:hypothetical protein
LRVSTLRSVAAVIGAYLAGAVIAFVNAWQSSAYPALAVIGLAPFIIAFVCTARIARKFAVLVPVGQADLVEFPVEAFQQELASVAPGDAPEGDDQPGLASGAAARGVNAAGADRLSESGAQGP